MSAGRQSKKFAKGELIFREGDPGECAYLIEQGRVQVSITKGDLEIPLRTIGKGEVFGEMALIDNRSRSASCRAVAETDLMIVTKEQLLDRIQGADPVVQLLLRALMERLRTQSDTIRGLDPAAPATDPAEPEEKTAIRKIELENEIAVALENDQFIPFYQPIYDLTTGAMAGVEALIRWIKDDGSIVPPAMFMDTVEESSLVIGTGAVMIEKCCRDLGRMRKQVGLDKLFFVSINVGTRQFSAPELLSNLEYQRAQFGIEAAAIKLEVTERVMMEGPHPLAILQKCRELGYKLAIDDFGTGFSCLQYLAAMPLTDLKIDRSFVSNMLTNEKSLVVVKALVQMAGLLGINLIAEGIETHEQLAALQGLGVSMGQGFLFSKPIPFDQLVAMPMRSQAIVHLKVA